MGKLRKRQSFSHVDEVLEMPDLIEVQKNSYQRFLDVDFQEVLDDVSPIEDYTGTLSLRFNGYSLGEPANSVERCKERDLNYAAPLKLSVSLENRETGEIKESEVFMGDFPLMTDYGTFIINGAERVVVSQLVRSPSTYYADTPEKKTGRHLFSTTVIPNRGAWLEYETDSNDVLWVRIDRARKMPLTLLLRALACFGKTTALTTEGMQNGTTAEILAMFGEDERLKSTLERDDDSQDRCDQALIEIYKKQKPGEPPTLDSARSLIGSLFFDPKRYDLMRVGRYKFNKKLSLALRIQDRIAAEDIADPSTGEVLVQAGEEISREMARRIQNLGINIVDVVAETARGVHRVTGNHFVDASFWLDFDPKEVGINENVFFPVLKELLEQWEKEGTGDQAVLKALLKEHIRELMPKNIIPMDIYASVSYLLGLPYGVGFCDDIDHLGNRRLRSVGELLQNSLRGGMSRLERMVRERMATQSDTEETRPGDLVNVRPLTSATRDFFGSSQLSQFMDQPNPLAELTHKRRLSALGPGGLNRERASMEVRDVHYSHYSRICPIETPEGPNIGLIGSLATYARINEYGFIEAPYRVVDPETHQVTDQVVYLTADEEDFYLVAEAKTKLNPDGTFADEYVTVRNKAEIEQWPREKVGLVDVSPRQVVSVATGMIPFLENDDATRALMGSNMQRQAVPLLVPEAPIVGTGMEYRAAHDSGVVILSKEDGYVKKVAADQVVIQDDLGQTHTYHLTKFARSNQGTCINQRPRVEVGQRIEKGDLLADGPSTEKGEIGLGRNALIGFMTWEGYNYEDAVLISEKLVKDDLYTSIHIEEFESEARETKLGPEEITRDIPNISEDTLKDLDEGGIIRIGAEVRAGDILVGKVTPKGETDLTAEERLLRAIFGEKAREVRDTSLRVPHGEGGIVVDVKIFTQENKDELASGVTMMVRVYIAQKRKISVGDKMAGRHGNKGVVSRILREEDMPFLPDGTPLQIVLNPMGVPSRMNLGQVLEVHLGIAAKTLGWHVATPVFDGATFDDIQEIVRMAAEKNGGHGIGIMEDEDGNIVYDEDGKPIVDGKTWLYDGRTGDRFENRVTVGIMYYLKLHHLVDDKMHARSVGPYSLVTQQPLGGKAQFGGQRFGEMEVWALEAYGAANTLQEILTVKSDDVVGRVKTYEAIVKGTNIPAPGIPESFKVLIKELKSLALDIRVLDAEKNEIIIKELEDEDDDVPGSSLLKRLDREDEDEQEALEEGHPEDFQPEDYDPDEVDFDEEFEDKYNDDDAVFDMDDDLGADLEDTEDLPEDFSDSDDEL